MPTLSWNLNAEVQNGPKIAVAQTLAIESYDKTEVTIPPKTDTPVHIPGEVQFLALVADRYGKDLTYKVSGGPANAIELDSPLILAGAGAVGLLGSAPTTLTFTNMLDDGKTNPKPVTVQILVGRKAT